MQKGARLAIVAGIIIAIAMGATFLAISSQPSTPTQPTDNGDNGNSTNSGSRQITVELNESMSVDAK